MRELLIVMYVFCGFGCGKAPYSYIEPSAQYAYDEFLKEAEAHGVVISEDMKANIVIKLRKNMKKEEDGLIGLCGTDHHFDFTVELDEEFWKTESDKRKQVLLFHELGHCFLGREHNEATKNKLPVSIMYPDIYEDYIYYQTEKTYKAYVDELFSEVNFY